MYFDYTGQLSERFSNLQEPKNNACLYVWRCG